MISASDIGSFMQQVRDYLTDTDAVPAVGLVVQPADSQRESVVSNIDLIPFNNGFVSVMFKRGEKYYRYKQSQP